MTLFAPPAPLPERLRPRSLDEVVGQAHLLGPGGVLRRLLAAGQLPSLILWGPPGVGKTTLARLLAEAVGAHLIALSAVAAGVADVRGAVSEAQAQRGRGRRTVLFLDEIHRFNKAQQDALLPHVESGTLTLVGATTENPSFEVNPALRSRARVLTLHPLEAEETLTLLRRGLAELGVGAEDTALLRLTRLAGGDARQALSVLEAAAALGDPVTGEAVQEAFGEQGAAMDKGGEDFYNLTSALHKSLRGSHPDAALHYLARLLRGGAPPRYVARRLERVAAEDIGLADPQALRLAVSARHSAELLGVPEGELALAQLTVYLALAPKSNAAYRAWNAAVAEVESGAGGAAVPLHLRNAPTALMRAAGHGAGYAYYFDDPAGSFAQAYLPAGVQGGYYTPGDEGWEARARERWHKLMAAHSGGEE